VYAERGSQKLGLKDANRGDIFQLLSQKNHPVHISAAGPYGHYNFLNDVDIFRDMAEAAPEATFTAEITGGRTYSKEWLRCKLENKILSISSYFEDINEGPDSYIEYFTKKISYKKFLKLFKVSNDDFDEDAYEEFIEFSLRDNYITDMEYDDFMDELEVESELTEEDFECVMEKLRDLSIKSYDDFMQNMELGRNDKWQYDPVSKKYIDQNPSILKFDQVYDDDDCADDDRDCDNFDEDE
jgi:hypothetical protein